MRDFSFDRVAMLCRGTEVYGVGTIQKIYAERAPEMLFICFEDGPFYQWLLEHKKRVWLESGPAAFKLSSLGKLFSFPFFLKKAQRAAKELAPKLAEHSIEVVHTHWLPQQATAGYLRPAGIKSVWQINNNSIRGSKYQLVKRFNHRLAKWGADLLLPASDFIANNWRGCGVPMTTIHNTAIPKFDRKIEFATKPTKCLSAGRLVHDKGHHVAVDAVIKLRQQGLQVCLDVFGGPLENNPYADQLQSKIVESGFEKEIVLKGFDTGLRNRHQEYHIAIQARLDPEPCSLWICECLTDGLIVFGSATGGSPELIEDEKSGFIYPPGDHQVLADKIKRLIEDSALAAKITQRAFERGNTVLGVDRFIDDTLKSYQQVVR